MITPELLRPADGWHSGLPLVECNEYVAAQLGAPKVQFDGVEEFFRKELELSAEQFPTVSLVGDPQTVTSGQLARYKKREGRVEVDPVAI